MIVGCLVRNYKIYENIVFIPLSKQYGGNLSALVGENGVGKSSVLESLDTFFNGREWNVNSNGKRDDAFVAPLFLIEKKAFKSALSPDFLEAISQYFWNIDETANPNISSSYGLRELIRFRDDIKNTHSADDYYLFLVGYGFQNNWPFFATFNSGLRDEVKRFDASGEWLEIFADDVCTRYAYVYIPVEASVQDVLRLESYELQELMSRDVVEVIDNIMNKSFKVNRQELGRDYGPNEVNTSILKIVNESLQAFVDSVNEEIRKIDDTYLFTYEKNTKKSLTSADIRDRIIEEYLSIRSLRKSGKPIQKLSSGEQRIALMDVAYSILSSSSSSQRNIVLAIDEPESSLHMSHCYRHFMRICELSERFGHQVILTSHWYGFIPVVKHGYLVYIAQGNSASFHISPLRSISAEMGSLPDDIALKSIFDLVSSILGLMRSESCDWLICEGADDQIYLEYFVQVAERRLFVLPMGGIGNVVKIYNYLYSPLSEKQEARAVDGKVICLIDTDPQPINPIEFKSLKGNLLTLRRLQIDGSGKLSLLELNPNSIRLPTALEDLIEADLFFEAVCAVVGQYGSSELKALLPKLRIKAGADLSRFSDNLSSLEGSDLESHLQIPMLAEFTRQHHIKYLLAKECVRLHGEKGRNVPDWVAEVERLFTSA